eukprot:1157875_1
MADLNSSIIENIFQMVSSFALYENVNGWRDRMTFALSLFCKGCRLNYPINIVCMEKIKICMEQMSMMQFIQSETVLEIIHILNRTNVNLNHLCWGYIRESNHKSVVPSDITDLIANVFCSVPCITTLRKFALNILANVIQWNRQHSTVYCIDHDLIDVLRSTLKVALSLQNKCTIAIMVHDISRNASCVGRIQADILNGISYECIKEMRIHLSQYSMITPTSEMKREIDFIVPILILYSKLKPCPNLQMESLEAIGTLPKFIDLNTQLRILRVLFDLLRSSSYQIQEKAMCVLGQFALYSWPKTHTLHIPQPIDKMWVSGLADILVLASISISEHSYSPTSYGCLSLLLRKFSEVSYRWMFDHQNIECLLQSLVCLFKRVLNSDVGDAKNGIILHICNSFRYLTGTSMRTYDLAVQCVVNAMQNNGFLEQFIQWIGNENYNRDAQHAALGVIFNLFRKRSSDRIEHPYAQQCVEAGAITRFYQVLSNSNADHHHHIICVCLYHIDWFAINPDLLPILLEILTSNSYYAATFVLHIIKRGSAQMKTLCVELDAIDKIFTFLRSYSHGHDVVHHGLVSAVSLLQTADPSDGSLVSVKHSQIGLQTYLDHEHEYYMGYRETQQTPDFHEEEFDGKPEESLQEIICICAIDTIKHFYVEDCETTYALLQQDARNYGTK